MLFFVTRIHRQN